MRVVLAICLVLSTPAAQAQTSGRTADTLGIGMRDDPDLLDPAYSRTYVGTVIMTALCDKLFDFDAGLNTVRMLATGYETPDATTLLIHVRPGTLP